MFKGKRKWIIIAVLVIGVIGTAMVIDASREIVHSSVTVEASQGTPELSMFLSKTQEDATFLSDVTAIDMTKNGTYNIEIIVDDKTYTSQLIIVDTVPPIADPVPQTITVYDQWDPTDFVTNIQDVADVTVSFEAKANYKIPGDIEVGIILEDANSNTTSLTVPLTLIGDDEAPVIEGVEDQTLYTEETISYKSGVSISDNMDPDPVLDIDTDAVDLRTPGTYVVTYRGTDAMGNGTAVESVITVLEKPVGYVTVDEANAIADIVLEGIITDDMSQLEKLEAIFWWSRFNIGYTGHSPKGDWRIEAVRGIKESAGDCYTYFAVAKLLINRIGVETIDIQRSQDTTRPETHYWSLVNYDGQWYHFDPCPLKSYSFKCFMKTDNEVDAFSDILTEYYFYDREGVPATPVEPLNTGI